MSIHHPDEHDDLRALLSDAVSDVHPTAGPEDVRRRAGSRPSPARWLPITVAAAAAMALLTGGITWLAHLDGSGQSTRHGGVSATARAGRDLHVPVYYVGRTAVGPRLFLEYHDVQGTTDTALQAAITQAVSVAPEDADYANPLRDFGVRAKATVTDSGADPVVDFSRAPQLPAGVDKKMAPLVVQALVRTAQAAAQVQQPVQFVVDGKRVDEVLGVDTRQAVRAGSDDDTLSPVSIDSPSEGSTMGGSFTVAGRASAVEGNVQWELLKRGGGTTGSGLEVQHGYATADVCCTLAPYSFVVSAAPGEYTLVVHDTDESGGEGAGITTDTKDITVE